jgi:hypothetical protein
MASTAAASSALPRIAGSSRRRTTSARSVVRSALTTTAENTPQQPTKKKGSFTFLPSAPREWDEDSNRLRFAKPEGVTRVTAPPGRAKLLPHTYHIHTPPIYTYALVFMQSSKQRGLE